MSQVASLILAAGRASRFGSDKRLALLPDGRTLLEAVLACHAAPGHPVLVVLRPGDAIGQQLAARHGAQVVVCEEADLGMGHSLASGARALLPRADVVGVLIGLADMPAVSAQTVCALRQALLDHALPVAPRYEGRLGHPRGLPRACFEALTALRGDQGARDIVDWRQAMHIEVADPGVLLDMDHPADWRALSA